jgi:PAS domain S-box-containing protein
MSMSSKGSAMAETVQPVPAPAATAEANELAKALLNASTDATMLFTPDGRLLACNTVLCERLGRSEAELVGRDLSELFSPDVVPKRRAVVRRVAETGVPEHHFDIRNGRHFDNHVYPVRDPQGRVDKVAVFSRDETERHEYERRIREHVEEIQRSNAELEQFAYVASHDLREPLRMVSSYVTLLERRYADKLDEEAREFIRFAREGAQRMDRLVIDLLEFARVYRAGRRPQPASAGDAVDLAVRNLQVAVAQSGARIAVAGPLPTVLADAGQMVSLFQNLIANAIKYRSPERPPLVRISARRQGDMWAFEVADNGIGIEPEYFDRIFRLFQRLHPYGSHEGTGIGLSIAKKIVEYHGGSIWPSSTPGQGTSFHFTLPAAD